VEARSMTSSTTYNYLHNNNNNDM